MLNDFKKFLLRGNILDLAVGVVLGAAFSGIVSSLVADVLMPPIGLILGGMDFSNLFVSLSGQSFATLAEAKKAGAPTLNYGVFMNAVINFVIVGSAIFLLLKGMERFRRKEAPAPVSTRACPECLSQVPIGARKCAHCTSALAGAG